MNWFHYVILVVLLLSAPAMSSELQGRAVSIADGDTFTLLTANKKQIRIRLAEIDTPESAQPYGNRSRQALSQLVFGKNVRVEVQDIDRYGRTVGRPYVGDVDVVDTVIRNIGGDPNRGIWVANGSSMLCIRCTIENHRTGILLRQGSEMVLNDSTVLGTQLGVDARGGSRFVSFLFNGTGPSTIEGVSQDALRLRDNASADITSGNINGRIRLFGSSVATLAGTSQSNPSLFVNVVRSGSSLVMRNSASLVEDFEITEFSNVTLPAGSTVSGSLFCSLGADAVCDTPLTATSFSDCGQCLNP